MQSFLKHLESQMDEEAELDLGAITNGGEFGRSAEQEQLRALMLHLQQQEGQGNGSDDSDEEAEVVAPGTRQHRELKNTVAYTCPEAHRALMTGERRRYVNEKIEAELVEFKEEIERNFWKSDINRTYVFKRLPPDETNSHARLVGSINRIFPRDRDPSSCNV